MSTHLKSRTASAELNSWLGIECITDVVRQADCGDLVMWRESIVMIWFQLVDVLEVIE